MIWAKTKQSHWYQKYVRVVEEECHGLWYQLQQIDQAVSECRVYHCPEQSEGHSLFPEVRFMCCGEVYILTGEAEGIFLIRRSSSWERTILSMILDKNGRFDTRGGNFSSHLGKQQFPPPAPEEWCSFEARRTDAIGGRIIDNWSDVRQQTI